VCAARNDALGAEVNTSVNIPALIEAVASVDRCAGYVVLVADPDTGEVDAHGPFDGLAATLMADELRAELDAGRRPEVQVSINRLHRPTGRHRARVTGRPGPTTGAAAPDG
jgi:hypothetical protein